jgi:hypothetical protein
MRLRDTNSLAPRTKKLEFSAEENNYRESCPHLLGRHRPALNNYERRQHTHSFTNILSANRNVERIISVAATVLLEEREIRQRPSAY